MNLVSIDSLVGYFKKNKVFCSIQNCTDSEIGEIFFSNVSTNSKEVKTGDLFIAYRGIVKDSHDFIYSAIQNGASIIIHETPLKEFDPKVIYIQVNDSRHAWALTECLLKNKPQDSLEFIGITGTNGKTSTGWYAYQLMTQNDIPCCLIGTLGIFLGGKVISNPHTTPDPDVLFAVLAECKKIGIKNIIMEVSSQSIVHNKIASLKFNTLIFTNFSQDHLDFHKDMSSYFAAKMNLFKKFATKDCRFIIHKSLKEKFFGDFTIKPKNLVEIYDDKNAWEILIDENQSFKGVRHNLTKQAIFCDFDPKIGYLRQNLTAAILSTSTKLNLTELIFKSKPEIPGRMQAVPNDLGIAIYIDYAHTPDALETAIRSIKTSSQQLKVIFGCGGNRDKEKRRIMGEISSRLADLTVLTNDNPRFESPEVIVEDIQRGIKNQNYEVELDRSLAIEKTIFNANPGDAILICGKGHEKTQKIGDQTLPFDDYEEARKAAIKKTTLA